MSVGIIKIPVLFDMSGDAVVFGEEVSGDFVTSHLDFLLDMTTEANDISLNAADISSAILIGDQDTGDNIFYSGGSSGNIAVDNLCNRIAKAITRGKLVHIPKAGDHSNSGIPMGGRANLTNNLGELGSSHAIKYLTSVAPIGDEQMLGQAMARVASIHLVGSPLAAGIFEDQNQIQTDLETASTQTFNDGNTAFYNALAVQLSKVLGGSKSSAPMNNGAGAPGPDLASQVFYENFEDQAIVGSQTTATIVSGGRDGTGYALQGDSTQANYYWWQTTSDSLPNNVLAVSFWHYAVEEGSVDIPQLFRFNSDGSYFGMDLINANIKYYISNTNNIVKWYVNGVDSDTHPDRSTSGNSVYVETTLNTWHHHYFELNTNPTEIRWMGHTTNDGERYRGTGKLDDVRLFNAALSTSQISDLAAGSNGSGSGDYPLDASGTSVPALKSIYEQLMNVPGRSQIMETRDISGVVDNSNVNFAGGFPFISGDKLVMYLRPKIVFAAQTKAEQNTTLITASGPTTTTIDVPVYDIGRKSSAGGAISGQVYTESSSHSDSATWAFHKCFEGVYDDDEDWTTAGDSDHLYDYSLPATSIKQYIGTIKTTNIDGTNELLGEWGQVDIGQNTVINKFQIWPRPSYRANRSPSQFSLLGSLDGTNWTTIKDVSGLVANDWHLGNGNTPDGTITWELGSVHGPYRYYRISIQSTVWYGDGRASLNGLLLFGAKSPSEVTTGSSGAVSDISGIQTNIVATPENIEDAFPGNATAGPEPEINKWGWMGSTNSDSLTLETTDVTDSRTCDLHIWKITITL